MESNRIQKSRVTAILRTSFFRKKEKTNERIRRDRSRESKIRKTFESLFEIIYVHFEVATKLEEVKLIRL